MSKHHARVRCSCGAEYELRGEVNVQVDVARWENTHRTACSRVHLQHRHFKASGDGCKAYDCPCKGFVEWEERSIPAPGSIYDPASNYEFCGTSRHQRLAHGSKGCGAYDCDCPCKGFVE